MLALDWKNLASLLTLGLLMSTPGVAEDGFLHLKIQGREAAWHKPGALPLKLSWTLAKNSSSWPGAVNCSRMKPVGSVREFSREVIRSQVFAASEFWSAQSIVSFTHVDREEDADIIVGIQQEPRGIAFADVLIGDVDNNGRKSIARGLVCLNPDANWKIGLDGNLRAYDFKYVIAHEIGHVLGLDHPDSNHQLMSFKYDERNATLQKGDIQGLRTIYGDAVAQTAPSKREQ